MEGSLKIDEFLSLEYLRETHTKEVFTLIEQNRSYLRQWLTWLDFMTTEDIFRQFIQSAELNRKNGTDYAFVIVYKESIVGRAGIYYIDNQNKTGSIGYWLDEKTQGRGIVTLCCKKLLEWGFESLGLNRIEIKCATGNLKSKAIPENLGFKYEGILRGAELLNGVYTDLNLFSMLKSEFIISQS